MAHYVDIKYLLTILQHLMKLISYFKTSVSYDLGYSETCIGFHMHDDVNRKKCPVMMTADFKCQINESAEHITRGRQFRGG